MDTGVYTDGSATNAVENGAAGIYIMDPSGYREEAHFPTGKHCTNYAANTISTSEANCSHVVFLTCCLPARLLKTTNLTDFQKLYILSAVSAKEQEDNWVTYEEMKSHIKSFYRWAPQ